MMLVTGLLCLVRFVTMLVWLLGGWPRSVPYPFRTCVIGILSFMTLCSRVVIKVGGVLAIV